MRTLTIVAALVALVVAASAAAEAQQAKGKRAKASNRPPPTPSILVSGQFATSDLPDWAKQAFAPKGQR